MAKKLSPIEELQSLINNLHKDFERWDDIYTNGCKDPLYEDGVNLYLKRNHIMIGKRNISEFAEKYGFGMIYDPIIERPTPDEVPHNYMANAEMLPVKAKQTVDRIEMDFPVLPHRVAQELINFKQAIQKNDLVTMRNKDYNYFKNYITREQKRLDAQPEFNAQLTFDNKDKQEQMLAKSTNYQDLFVTNKLKAKYENILNRLPQEWQPFLDCASNIYKHSFGNLVMIYGQYPQATMVATAEVWAKSGRQVGFDKTAIVTIAQTPKGIAEKRLYDISHTTGAEIVRPSYYLQSGEKQLLLQSLCTDNNLSNVKLLSVISNIIKQRLVDTNSLLLPEYGSLIHNSVLYMVTKQLGVQVHPNFDKMKFVIDTKNIIKIGNLLQPTARTIMDTLTQIIQQIREEKIYGNNRDGRTNLYSAAEREILAPDKRDSLQARLARERDTDISPRLGNTGTGQLSFGQIRNDAQELYGSRTHRANVGADNGRSLDEASTRKRGTDNYAILGHNGQPRTTASSPSDKQLLGDGRSRELATVADGGDNKRRDIQTNLSFSPKSKFIANIEAIKLLKQLEYEHKAPDELSRQVLCDYVGWGGIPQVFDQNNQAWQSEYAVLKELLTDDEYVAARESTLTAFYTPPEIVGAIHSAIVNLGFTGEINILEPSCGDGRFIDNLPLELQHANVLGIELDNLTGRLAQMLHTDTQIYINGYQNVNLADNYFDVILGNVPFGEYKISDARHSRLIHDFFFARSIDKLKPGGILAFITTKGTLDKKNPVFRQWLADRAELLIAVRLPDDTFKNAAGTEVTSDIIFLRKREQPIKSNESWIHTTLLNKQVINEYFADNPQNMIGEMKEVSSRYGKSTALKAIDGINTVARLNEIFNNLQKLTPVLKHVTKLPVPNTILADPNVKNYTFTLNDNSVYFRNGDEMFLCEENTEQLTKLIVLRESLHAVIDAQLQCKHSNILEATRINLNNAYNDYTQKYGALSNRKTKQVFSCDAEYALLLSVENVSTDGIVTKANIFFEATIKPPEVFVPKSYSDLVTLSMSKLGYIDLAFMAEQFSVTVDDVKSHLTLSTENGMPDIFFDPEKNRYLPADLYLCGNVKRKLAVAKSADLQTNIKALESVQPKPLTCDEINIRLGSTFIDIKYYREFMYEIAQTPYYLQETDEQSRSRISLVYNKFSSEYTIYNKGMNNNVQVNTVYGTGRKGFYEILESSLNLQDVKVYDTVKDGDKTRQVLNGKETTLARKKQELVRAEFKNWIFAEPQRAQDVINTYNDLFNIYRNVQYNGTHLSFDGMSNQIELRPHQRDAIARCLYSGQNVLLAHEVGAGKTYTMIAAAMELKRLGLANKSLFVVPNHLIEQWGSDFMKLYPGANILVSTKKDFEPLNRKRFVARIATGEYDAVIIGHSQFERIPMSSEYIKDQLQQQLSEITIALSRLDKNNNRYTVKQFEAEIKKIEDKLENIKLGAKDDVITFEETGVDNLYVDEAHGYKNCFIHTKMNNVAGITTTNAQKSFDMLMKTKYITEKNNGRGITFATGTPISNSMTEMFVLQRYLQQDALRQSKVAYFDEWASNFGETVTALELKPEGSGYRLRTRFAKFHNLPELIGMFSQVADIKVKQDLNLPLPKIATGKPIIEVSKPSDFVKDFIKMLAVRAGEIRDGKVEPWEDNMLKITSEGKAVAIDARLIDPYAPVDYDSKIYRCCSNVVDLYKKHENSLQLIFLDTGLPLYEIIRNELVDKGIPIEKVAFIHDAKTDNAKATLFEKCRSGEVAVLIGSTQKMGAGTNVQTKLVANHHLDCPWRPADIEQRDGRAIRQGNSFSEVYIYRYITENTFDAYLWSIQENKQKFISQVMTNKSVARSCDDIDDAVLNCAEVKTLATGDPRIKEKMQLDNDIYLLQIEKAGYQQTRVRLQNVVDHAPNQINQLKQEIYNISTDLNTISDKKNDKFSIVLGSVVYTERAKAAEQLQILLHLESGKTIGEYCGLQLIVSKTSLISEAINIEVRGAYNQIFDAGTSMLGNIARIEHCDDKLVSLLNHKEDELSQLLNNVENAKVELLKPFSQEKTLNEMIMRQIEINAEIEEQEGDNVPNLNNIENAENKEVNKEQQLCANNYIER